GKSLETIEEIGAECCFINGNQQRRHRDYEEDDFDSIHGSVDNLDD
ncbi:hypothetical protein A2U01_0020027, partial [Trifolium medium]|nr:hypothetical protein [Trifolium medium]